MWGHRTVPQRRQSPSIGGSNTNATVNSSSNGQRNGRQTLHGDHKRVLIVGTYVPRHGLKTERDQVLGELLRLLDMRTGEAKHHSRVLLMGDLNTGFSSLSKSKWFAKSKLVAYQDITRRTFVGGMFKNKAFNLGHKNGGPDWILARGFQGFLATTSREKGLRTAAKVSINDRDIISDHLCLHGFFVPGLNSEVSLANEALAHKRVWEDPALSSPHGEYDPSAFLSSTRWEELLLQEVESRLEFESWDVIRDEVCGKFTRIIEEVGRCHNLFRVVKQQTSEQLSTKLSKQTLELMRRKRLLLRCKYGLLFEDEEAISESKEATKEVMESKETSVESPWSTHHGPPTYTQAISEMYKNLGLQVVDEEMVSKINAELKRVRKPLRDSLVEDRQKSRLKRVKRMCEEVLTFRPSGLKAVYKTISNAIRVANDRSTQSRQREFIQPLCDFWENAHE